MYAEVTPAVVLSLLHGFILQVHGTPVPLIWSAQRLVAFLALMDWPPSRAYVAGTLWPDTTLARASANLRSSLWRVQRACGRLVVASAQHISLAPDVVIDVRNAIACARRLLDPTAPCEDILTVGMLSALSVDLLPDWYDDWVVAHREQYHQLRLHALEAMCERLTAVGRHSEAVEAGLAAVRAEPLRESAQQALVKAHLAEGNRFEAVRQYNRCRYLLQSELGLEPSFGLRALVPGQFGQPISRAGRRRTRTAEVKATGHTDDSCL